MSATPFHASQLRPLAELIEQEIERQILAGDLKVGARVNELALSRTLGVSRGPIREALQGLRRAGLVEIVTNRGAIVRSLGAEAVLDLYDLRGSIFATLAERLADLRTAAHIKTLEANIAASEAAIAANDPEAYYRLNIAFHDAIAEMSGMVRAGALYRDLVKEMHLYRRRGLITSTENRKRSLAEHRSIIAAIRKKDAARAFAAARAHIGAGKARFQATLDLVREAPAA